MPDGPEPIDNPHPELPHPNESASTPSSGWSVVAHNKAVIRGWSAICKQINENAVRCYEWLRATPTRRIPGRCYPLRHSGYTGCWGFEVGSGQRVYYRPDEARKTVLVYYAGPHPSRVPRPPES